MSAFPDPPSTSPSGSVNPTSTTPTRVTEDMDSDNSYDFTSSSDGELVQGPAKKVKLTPRDSAADAVKDDAPVPAKGAASPKDDTLTEGSVDSDKEAPATVPADADADGLVATPPPTSPALGPREDPSVAVPEDSLPVTTVSDALSDRDERSPSPCSTDSHPFCAEDYPIFNPDAGFEFADWECETFTDPGAYRNHLLERKLWGLLEPRITRHLQDCLKGSALTWYREELNDEERRDLRHGDLEDWFDALSCRFSHPCEHYIEKIKQNPLDWNSVRESRDIDWWLYDQFNRAIALTDLPWEALHIVWELMAPELRDHVPEPQQFTVYHNFLCDLEHARGEWRPKLGLSSTTDSS